MITPLDVSIVRAWWQVCLFALTIWREARGASIEARIAVAFSIMNRVERPSWWGKTLDQILGKKWQYSSMAAPDDPQLILWPLSEDPVFQECMSIANAVLNADIPNPFPGADSYYDSSLDKIGKPPAWALTAKFCGEVKSPKGNSLRFFDVDHDFEKSTTGHV